MAGSYSKPVTLMSWLENQFLDAPIQKFRDVEFVCGRASDFVNPAELAKLLAGFAEDAKDFSVEREFVGAAVKCIGAEEHRVGSGRSAKGAWCAGRHSGAG